jgi:hypothetical protein
VEKTALTRAAEGSPTALEKAVIRQKVIARPRVRNRQYNRKFMDEQLKTILADKEHRLSFLVDREAGKWRATMPRHEHAPAVQAGHKVSLHSEIPEHVASPERLFLEDADQNWSDGIYLERKGTVHERTGVMIDGVPVERGTAIRWERLDLMEKGTVEVAPQSEGWTPLLK